MAISKTLLQKIIRNRSIIFSSLAPSRCRSATPLSPSHTKSPIFYVNGIYWIFFIICTIWIFNISQQEAVSMASRPNNFNLKLDKEFSGIAKVTDGDSIKVDDKKIRLMGIDAPEYSQTCFDKNYNEYACGKVSKEFLMKLANDKEVKCYYAKFDKYNRYLSECYIGEVMINHEILRNGMAVTYTFGPADQEMARLEADAQEKKIGIWQGAFQLPKDYRKTHRKK